MDYVTRQLINLTKKLRKESRKVLVELQHSIDKHTEAVEKAAKAQEKQAQANADIFSQIKQSQSRIYEHNARNESWKQMDWVKLSVEIATLFVIFAYTTLTAYQLIQVTISADAAKTSADTAQKELVQANRPWLGADHLTFTAPVRIVKLGGAPDLYMLQALMAYKYEIRNYGKDPALRVHYHAEAIEFRLGTDVVDGAQDMRCKAADGEFSKDIGNGAAIFPSDFLDATNDNAPGILIQPRKIFGNNAPDTANGKFYIAGCTSYVDQFFDITKAVHHTRFCFISDSPLRQIAMGTELRRCRREIRAD
jgi:hypothetical protein